MVALFCFGIKPCKNGKHFIFWARFAFLQPQPVQKPNQWSFFILFYMYCCHFPIHPFIEKPIFKKCALILMAHAKTIQSQMYKIESQHEISSSKTVVTLSYILAKLWNQVPSSGHFGIWNCGDFLCWILRQVGCYDVAKFRFVNSRQLSIIVTNLNFSTS